LNSCCLNYAFNHNLKLIEVVQYFKKTFFDSQNQVDLFVDVMLKDYFKFFGFVAGIKNNYFNYYDSLINYSYAYFLVKDTCSIDFVLLKYLLV
jgi:hypothetical protein